MNISEPDNLLPTPEIEALTQEIGHHIFEQVRGHQPSILTKNFWSAKLLAWSMRRPELKSSLFRLVDVLPSLDSDEHVYEHVRAYLGPKAVGEIFPGASILFSWAMASNQPSIRRKFVAFTVRKAVQEMAGNFIAGSTPEAAINPLRLMRKQNLAFTVDILGEYSLSERESLAYLERYLSCIKVLGTAFAGSDKLKPNHRGESSPVCISVKLSALYSQCSPLNSTRTVKKLCARLTQIAEAALAANAQLYVDAEDSSHNPMIYEAFMETFSTGSLKQFHLPGVVVQAYAKDSLKLVEQMHQYACERGNPIAIRLVKGAYWDHETIIALQQGWESPLFAEKRDSDAQFEIISAYLLTHRQWLFPALASHNVRSLAHACAFAQKHAITTDEFELQTLHGMAEPITQALAQLGYLVRVYLPLGSLIPGMGYLIRRLLENTSNESFLRHTFIDKSSIANLLASPHNVRS